MESLFGTVDTLLTEAHRAYVKVGLRPPAEPVVLSVPHSGRDYGGLEKLTRVPLARLEALEDRRAERLIDGAVERGTNAIVATRARAWIDLNRDVDDLDPGMIAGMAPRPLTLRARAGLGLVPRHLAPEGELWRRPINQAELTERMDDHAAYHAAIARLLADTVRCFGRAILLDIHSMPPLPGGSTRADVVLGDRYGRTANPGVMRTAANVFRQEGLRVEINRPYAGGAIVTRHGQPRSGIDAIQIEFCRTLYLERDLRSLSANVARMQRVLATLVTALQAHHVNRVAAE